MSQNQTTSTRLRVRIKRLPNPREFEEFDLSRYRVGEVFTITPRLASLLILSGCAELVGEVAVSEEAP